VIDLGTRRRALTVTAFALALLLPTAAAAPARTLLDPVRTVHLGTGAAYQIVGDSLYVTEAQPANDRLVAYPLPSGPPRWSVPLPILSGDVELAQIDDLLLVSVVVSGPVESHTTAVDRATGAVRWESQLPVAALDLVRHRVLLGQSPHPEAVDLAPSGDLEAVAAATGARVWNHHRQAGCLGDLPRRIDKPGTGLGVLCADGTLSVVDLDSGRVRATAATLATAPGLRFGSDVIVLPDQVLVDYPARARTVVASFDMAHLRPQWTVELEPTNYGVAGCGAQLCMFSFRGLLALDLASGTVSWRLSPADRAVALVTSYLAVTSLSGDRLRMVDTETGSTVLDLGGWRVASYLVGPPVLYHREPGTHRMWVGTLTVAPPGVRVLGAVPNPDSDYSVCDRTERYLACRTVRDAVQVWRIGVPG